MANRDELLVGILKLAGLAGVAWWIASKFRRAPSIGPEVPAPERDHPEDPYPQGMMPVFFDPKDLSFRPSEWGYVLTGIVTNFGDVGRKVTLTAEALPFGGGDPSSHLSGSLEVFVDPNKSRTIELPMNGNIAASDALGSFDVAAYVDGRASTAVRL